MRRDLQFIQLLIASIPALPLQAVEPPIPVLKTHPDSQRVLIGHAVRLTGGFEPLPGTSFGWEKFGQRVPDRPDPFLDILHALPSDSGSYQLVARNALNEPGVYTAWESASRPAQLSVVVPPESPGGVDLGFRDAGFGKGKVMALAADAVGRVLAAGKFDRIGNLIVGSIIRINSDGSPDRSFVSWPGAGPEKPVRAVVAHGDGWIVGGDFDDFHGRERKRLARLHSNGEIDPLFLPAQISTGNVRALAIQKVDEEERVLVGLSGAPWLMRLRENGSEDKAFAAVLGVAGLNNTVTSLVVQADNRVVLGGAFGPTKNGATTTWPFRRVGRLMPDGSPDWDGFHWFKSNPEDPKNGADGEVRTLALDSRKGLIIGGNFNSIHGEPRGRLARLYADGKVDTTFAPEPDDPVEAVAILNSDKIAAVGEFTKIDDETSPSVALLNPGGTLVSSWQPASFDTFGLCLAVGLADRVFVGGEFSQPHAGVVALRSREFEDPPRLLSELTPFDFTIGMTGIINLPVQAHPDTNYHWRRFGQTEALATISSTEWVIPRVAASDAGLYEVEIDGPNGPTILVGPIEIRVHPRPPGARAHQLGLPTELPLIAPLSVGEMIIPIRMPAFEVGTFRVTLAIEHGDTDELNITLTSPNGLKHLQLFDPTKMRRGMNFNFTVFADQATALINAAGSPYVGTFRPSATNSDISEMLGAHAAGEWSIKVDDDGNDGKITRVIFASIDLFGPEKALTADSMARMAMPADAPELLWRADTRVARLHHWQPLKASTPIFEYAESLTGWSPLPAAALLRHRREPDQTATSELQLPTDRVQPHAFFRATWR